MYVFDEIVLLELKTVPYLQYTWELVYTFMVSNRKSQVLHDNWLRTDVHSFQLLYDAIHKTK